MTRTAADTDRLLDALIAARKRTAAANAEVILVQAANRKLTRERDDALALHRAAEAENAELRELNRRGRDLLAGAVRPSPLFTLGHLIGVGIGALVVGAAGGAMVAAELVGRLPW